MYRLITGIPGPSGFGSSSTGEEVTEGIDGTNLTAIVTGRLRWEGVAGGRRKCQQFGAEGGASGIGLETARVLALRNVHVVIAARNVEAANEAKQMILHHNAKARVDVLKLHLDSLDSIDAFARSFIALRLPLHILINNAGVMFCPFQLSRDGIEMQFATNHLGHFYLTNLLLDKMKDTAKSSGVEGRIVNLSSVAHLHTCKEGIQFDRINDETSYDDKKAYGQSKLANLLHANELSRRLQEEGADIRVNSVHPGLIHTNLFRYSGFLVKMLRLATCFLWKDIPQGAATTCYAALHPSLKGETGKYFVDCNEFKPSRLARDEALARRLWDFSCNMIHAAKKVQ